MILCFYYLSNVIIYYMFSKLRDKATLLKAKLTKDELEEALIEATTEDNWQASTTVLHQIASSAYNHEKWEKIREFVWDKIKNNRGWKKLLKAMNIIQFLLKNGPTFVIDYYKYQLNRFKTLQSYSIYEGDIDRGSSIREKAKSIVNLLQNDEFLEDERVRAKQIRQKMSHLVGTTALNSEGKSKQSVIPKYQSYNSQNFVQSKTESTYYNYGSGNYGDRQDDNHHRTDYFQNVNRFKKTEPVVSKPQIVKRPESSYVQPVTPAVIAPIPQVVQPAKVSTDEKPKYQTMAQRLIRTSTTPSVTKQPIKPDLSYKKKNDDDLLIDTEASFVQHRYKAYERQQPLTAQQPITYTQTQSVVTSQPVITNSTPVYIPPAPVEPVNKINLFTQLDGFDFLGTSGSKTEVTTSVASSVTPATNILSSAQVKPQLQPQQQITSPQPAQPLLYTPQTPQPIYSTHPTIASYSPSPYGVQMTNASPSYSSTYGNPYNNYAQPNYYSNPYQMNSMGAYNQSYYPNQQYNPYIQQQQHLNYSSPIYSNQTSSYYQQNQHYAPPVYSNPSPSVVKPSAVSPSKSYNQQQDQFSNFKSAASFDIEKINWMSNKQKSLTDLADLSISDMPKPKPQKEFTNNIKIDNWNW